MTDIDVYLEQVLKRCEKETPSSFANRTESLLPIEFGSLSRKWAKMVEPDEDVWFYCFARADLPRLARYCQKLREALKYYSHDGDFSNAPDVANEVLNLNLEDL